MFVSKIKKKGETTLGNSVITFDILGNNYTKTHSKPKFEGFGVSPTDPKNSNARVTLNSHKRVVFYLIVWQIF